MKSLSQIVGMVVVGVSVALFPSSVELAHSAQGATIVNELVGNTYRFVYDGGHQYLVSFRQSEVHWKAVGGPELGRSETDRYRSFQIRPGIHFVQWIENDGTAVTLTIDLANSRVFSSIRAGEAAAFMKGVIARAGVEVPGVDCEACCRDVDWGRSYCLRQCRATGVCYSGPR